MGHVNVNFKYSFFSGDIKEFHFLFFHQGNSYFGDPSAYFCYHPEASLATPSSLDRDLLLYASVTFDLR